ncbi:HEPN domain-containing protein [Parabacteroides bouchesdurhonensis]|uniref:HEPN domain-containing protein n=1 Tax=Parabacteroides bouchesdurhonensis TaxID=1936995 RepID=UPI000E4A62F8|nr:HEPN domain-containing protein [Parabacteroides bouchesdurhonensis]RHJ92098.1 HEPN domain-containing protein [Bacteroides sp. AM07-16]
MKNSIAYLPKDKQEDLNFLVNEVLKRLPQTEYIILYGSYARDNYVKRGIRVEDGGIPTVKISDYDILVITSGINSKKAETVLDNVEDIFFAGKDFDRDTPVQFINDDIKILNKYIGEGRYFYTQIKEEGIILYNSGKYKLARRRKLNFDEIKEQAQEYFDEKFQGANEFFHGAKLFYNETYYKKSSFLLHQACENYYYAIRLTFTLRNNKQHNLSKLSGSVKRYSEDLKMVFPQDTPEEKRLFTLLKAAYVDARYNPHFVVTKEDIDALIPKVELLRDITERICIEKIKEYGKKK